jgi:uncharacterized membrane protein
MEELIHQFEGAIALGLETIAVIVVAIGSIDAAGRLFIGLVRQSTTHGDGKAIWRRYGMWLLLGLEFELAADIVTSVIAPTWKDLGELAAIAVIRTFLNYFLEKDVSEADESWPARSEGLPRAAETA